MRTFLYQVLFVAIAIAVLLPASGVNARAQKVGEWVVVDSIHQGRLNTSPNDVESAGPGDYVVMVQEDAAVGPYMLRHTTDAGATWNVVRADSGYKWRLTDIAHPTPDRILAIGDTAMQISGDTYQLHPFVLVSQDAGSSWSRIDLLDGVYISSLSMYDDLHGAILGARNDANNQIEYLIFTTSDGGLTWQMLYPKTDGLYLSNIVSLSPSRIATLGYDPQTKTSVFYRTTDGGGEWSSYSRPSAIATVDFVDSLNGWGVGGSPTGIGDTRTDFIAHTTDGGETWQTVIDTPIDFRFGLFDVSFADDMHGIAVGSYGKILRTSDGGVTWIQDWPEARLVAEYVGFRKVAYAAPDEALATTGFSGYVLKYTGRQKLPAPKITEPSGNLAEIPLSLTVRWTSVEDALWYDLQVADTTYEYNYLSHHIYDVPYVDAPGLAETEKAIQLEPRTRYVFRVRARNTTDTSDWSVYLYTISRNAGQTLSAPVFITPEMGATNVLIPTMISWSAIDGATGYDLMVADNPVYLGTPAVNETNIQGTSNVIAALKPGTTYFARVRARNATEVGNWSSLSVGNHQFTTSATSSVHAPSESIGTSLMLLPNPVSGGRAVLDGRIGKSGLYRIALVNVFGEEVMLVGKSQLEQGVVRIPVDLSMVPAGDYFIRISGAETALVPVVVI